KAQLIKVLDKTTRIPIVSAEVFNNARTTVIETDAKGQFELSEFNSINTINIRQTGFPDYSATYDELKNLKFILLSDEIVSYNMVVYSGTRGEQKKGEISNRIIVISPEQFKLQNPQTAADLLASSGEVFVQKSQLGGGSPMI